MNDNWLLKGVAVAVVIGTHLVCEATAYGTADRLEYRNGRIGWNRDSATLVFPGQNLADWTPKFSRFRAVADSQIFGASGPAFAYNIKECSDATGEGVSADFQRWSDPDIFSIRVFFFQADEGIKAYVSHARYSLAGYYLMGWDLVAMYAAGDRRACLQSVATDTRKGYGITHLLMERKSPTVVRPVAYSDLSGSVKVKAESELVLDDAASFVAAFPTGNSAALDVDGKLTVRGIDGTFSGTVNGSGTISFEGALGHGFADSYADFIQNGGTIILTNRLLSTITNITCNLKGGNAPSGVNAKGFLFEDNGTSQRWGMQADRGTFLTHVPLTLTQEGVNVRAVIGRGRYMMFAWSTDNIKKYAPGGKVTMGMDMEDPHYVTSDDNISNYDCYVYGAISYDGKSSGLGIHSITCTFSDSAFYNQVCIGGENQTTTGSVLVVSGPSGSHEKLSMTTLNAEPKDGLVLVRSGAELSLDFDGKSNNTSDDHYKALIRVETNACLSVPRRGDYKAYYQIGHAQIVEVRGGTISVVDGAVAYETGQDSNCYFNDLVFDGGGRIKCPTWLRIGNRIASSCTGAVWRVMGSGAVICDAGWNLTAQNEKPEHAFLLLVDNASGDAEPDLVVNGKVTYYDKVFSESTHGNMGIVKDFSGTVRFNGEFAPPRPTRINCGAVEFGASGITSSEQDFELNGGTFALAAGVTNAVGEIAVSKSSTIALKDGASLSVADCSGATWKSGATVNIDCDLSKVTLRFGSSDAALTASQLQMLRNNGKRVWLDATGKVVRMGTAILIR